MVSLINIEKGIYYSFSIIAFFIYVAYTSVVYEEVIGNNPDLSTSGGRFAISITIVLMIKLVTFIVHMISQILTFLHRFSNKTSTLYVAITALMINVLEILIFILLLFSDGNGGHYLAELTYFPEIFVVIPTACIYFIITLIHLITLTVYTRNQSLVSYTELQPN